MSTAFGDGVTTATARFHALMGRGDENLDGALPRRRYGVLENLRGRESVTKFPCA